MTGTSPQVELADLDGGPRDEKDRPMVQVGNRNPIDVAEEVWYKPRHEQP
jgi:hypothetical protein